MSSFPLQILLTAVISNSISLALQYHLNCQKDADCGPCPRGSDSCILNCKGKDHCKGAHSLTCKSGTACSLHCYGSNACTDSVLYANRATSVSVTCRGSQACQGNTIINCQRGAPCHVRCDYGNCNGLTINVNGASDFICDGNADGLSCPPSAPPPYSSSTAEPTQEPTFNPTPIPTPTPTDDDQMATSPIFLIPPIPGIPEITEGSISQSPTTTSSSIPIPSPPYAWEEGEPTPSPTPHPTPINSSEATLNSRPNPAPREGDLPTINPTPEPIPKPTSDPTIEPTPDANGDDYKSLFLTMIDKLDIMTYLYRYNLDKMDHLIEAVKDGGGGGKVQKAAVSNMKKNDREVIKYKEYTELPRNMSISPIRILGIGALMIAIFCCGGYAFIRYREKNQPQFDLEHDADFDMYL